MTFRIDWEYLINLETLTAGLETDDETGCVLKFHLESEEIIEFYASHTTPYEVLKLTGTTDRYVVVTS
jgi:hypothetical protein